jgi:hypothetical protein
MLLTCSLVALALAGSPVGGRPLETTIQDDAALLASAPALVREAARRMAWLGPTGCASRRAGRRWNDFQSGLFFADGTPKPAAQAFRLPFWAEVRELAGQPVVTLFGGERRRRLRRARPRLPHRRDRLVPARRALRRAGRVPPGAAHARRGVGAGHRCAGHPLRQPSRIPGIPPIAPVTWEILPAR